MFKNLTKLDSFSKNILIVFLASSVANVLNLLYQLCIAHAFSAADFAGFNALLSCIVIVASPWGTVQFGVANYCAERNAQGQEEQIRALLVDMLKKVALVALAVVAAYGLAARSFFHFLKLPSSASGIVLAGIFILLIIMPVLFGGLQGLERFKSFAIGGLFAALLKLGVSLLFVAWGFGITGALSGVLVSNLAMGLLFYWALRRFLRVLPGGQPIGYKKLFWYLLPVGVSNCCFMLLVNLDMILVRGWFNPADSGNYSLAQMVGKIFLFLPGAISIVLFPRAAGLHAKAQDTSDTLKKSLILTLLLCVVATLAYNLAPGFLLGLLTGKKFAPAIALGRFFSVSMSLYTLGYVMITYFLSVKDFRFVKYLVAYTLMQCAGFLLFHKNPFQIQAVMCVAAAGLCATLSWYACNPKAARVAGEKL